MKSLFTPLLGVTWFRNACKEQALLTAGFALMRLLGPQQNSHVPLGAGHAHFEGFLFFIFLRLVALLTKKAT